MSNDVFQRNQQFLQQYRIIMSKVDRLEAKLERLDARRLTINSSKITNEPKSSVIFDLSDVISLIDSTNRLINNYIKMARDVREEIEGVICNLDNQLQADILDMYFIERLNLSEIAETLGYSYRHINRLYYKSIRLCDISHLS